MNRNRWLASLLGALLLTATAAPVGAVADAQKREPLGPAPTLASGDVILERPAAWFIELAGFPVSDGGEKEALRRERENFKANAKKAGLTLGIRYEYDALFNGLSVSAEGAELAVLASIPGVRAVYPVIQIDRPVVSAGDERDLFEALAVTGVEVVQAEMGYTGRGIKVAVIDTGIDYHHPDLGGCIGSGCRVATGWDFVGDAFNADPAHDQHQPVPVPDPFPDDCDGHGTHVAGIIGANGRVRGVAPDVTFGAYRIFGCKGATTADILLAAMERAQADGMQVMNLSLDAPFQWPQYPTAMAANRLSQKGMVVVASIGGSGAHGLYAAGAPGVGWQAIGVAAFENRPLRLPLFTTAPGGERVGFVQASGSPKPPTKGTYPLAQAGTACSPLEEGSLEGQIALVGRGLCPFHEKAHHAQAAGAVGVILYNNAPGMLAPTVAGGAAVTIPVLFIAQAQGEMLDDMLTRGAVELSWSNQMGSFPNSLGAVIASASSYGPAPDLSLKPDIGAPGTNIYATYPLEAGGYATLSGSSLAAPHVAGAAALLLEARPKTYPHEVMTLLLNNAQPKSWWATPGTGNLDHVHRQGAGMLQVDRAILAPSKIDPSKLVLYESDGRSFIDVITIENRSKEPVVYRLSHAPALATGPNTFAVQALASFASASFGAQSITLDGGHRQSVQVKITPPANLPDGSIFGGYIVVTPDGGEPMRLPYVGFKGDYRGITALAPAGQGLPWLARLADGAYTKQDAGATFTMREGDIPYILYHLDHQVERIRVELREAKTDQLHQLVAESRYGGRSTTPTSTFGLAFDGKSPTGKPVPNGTYVLVLKVLKADGDQDHPDHWETWTSPAFTIDRSH